MAEALKSEHTPAATKRVARGAMLEAEELPGAGLALGGLDPEMLVHANEAVSRGMVAIGQELSRFVGQRLRADMEASRSLLACTEIESAMQVQRSFIETAMSQYAEESRTLADLVGAMVRESMGVAAETRH
jgi:hypothetical protein